MNSNALRSWIALLACIWGSWAFAETTAFGSGQLWECKTRHDTASPDERVQFLVTGVATNREVSRRLNFQNDDPVVSVALIDLDPKACAGARRFLHMAYSEEGLRACAPILVKNDSRLSSPNAWKSARDARGSWLIGMQSNKGVVIDLSPSKFLAMLRRQRC
jgi:hypothetical protein